MTRRAQFAFGVFVVSIVGGLMLDTLILPSTKVAVCNLVSLLIALRSERK